MFVNLLVNATQAMPEGEAHINEIRVTTRTDELGRVVIEIKDTGSGIPPEVSNRVFEPFFTTRRTGEGLGLGLAVTRDVIAALDGEITIDSVVGKGTTVRIALPATEFSTQGSSTRSRTLRPARMIAWPSPSMIAAPAMSFFMLSMLAAGFRSSPPVSKHTPLPTSVTLGPFSSPQMMSTSRGARVLARPTAWIVG